MSVYPRRALDCAIGTTICALCLVGLLAAPAQANGLQGSSFTWNPAAVGLAGVAFSGDALKGVEYSNIAFGMSGDWTEKGLLKITDVMTGGTVTTPTALNDAYTLYLGFEDSGSAGPSGVTVAAASLTLYGVNGASTFGIDGSHAAFVQNGTNTPIELARLELIVGTAGNGAAGSIFSTMLTTFVPTSVGSAFFAAPDRIIALFGDFHHPATDLTDYGAERVIQGGDDTLILIPEPGSLLLLGAVLPGLLGRRRRT
jgi:hypothetical protein